MTDSTLLLTGGTGVMGWRLARRFSQAGYGVHLLVRKASRKGLRERVTAFRAEAPAAADRMRLVTGDLLGPQLADDEGLARIVADCDAIVHAASERRSDKPRDQVFDTNLEGTKRLLALARELERPLRRFLHVSDLSVFGDFHGVAFEADLLVGQQFGGDIAAESRLLAERHVRKASRDLPVTVVRLAHPVVEQRDPARVADPLQSLGRGSLRARLATMLDPADAPWVHALPAALLADLVLAAFEDEHTVGATLHLADAHPPTADELFSALGRPGSALSLGMPAEGARMDTTQAEALARRHGLVIPGAMDWMPRLR